MRICAQSFGLPKAGNSETEYEDASWPNVLVEGCLASFRAAVADGATESSFSGLWARMLVEAWGRHALGERSILSGLPPLQRAWLSAVSDHPLPWYAEEKVRSGAFSSLLGLSLAAATSGAARSGSWRALTVGDSCLFCVQGDELRRSFPLHSSDQFDNRPHLLSSNMQANAAIRSHIRLAHGRWLPGDTILCMTDALALWFLQAAERSQKPWRTVCALADTGSREAFAEWVGELRGKRLLRNDDVTLLIIRLT